MFQDHLDAMTALSAMPGTEEQAQMEQSVLEEAKEVLAEPEPEHLPDLCQAPEGSNIPLGFEELRVDLLGFLEDAVLNPKAAQPALLGGVPGEECEVLWPPHAAAFQLTFYGTDTTHDAAEA